MSQDEEDIILAELPDDELVEQMFDDLYDGLADEIAEGTQILLDRGWEAKKVLDEALVGGMNIVGIDFRDGILFVPEVLMAANAMKAGMAILQPILSASGAEPGRPSGAASGLRAGTLRRVAELIDLLAGDKAGAAPASRPRAPADVAD